MNIVRGKLGLASLFIFTVLNVFSAEIPKKWTPELMMQVKNIEDIQISPDNKKAAYTVTRADMPFNLK